MTQDAAGSRASSLLELDPDLWYHEHIQQLRRRGDRCATILTGIRSKRKQISASTKSAFARQRRSFVIPINCRSMIEHSDNEDRWITIGIDSSGVLRVVVHTFAQVTESLCEIRIISARSATSREIRQYREGTE